MSTTNETPRKARLLTRLRINEVSACDKGAGQDCKIILMKRADDEPRSKPHVERAERMERRRREREEFERLWGDGRIGKSFNEVMADHDASEDPRRAPGVDHHVSRIADLLHEAGSFATREQALAHLLHTKDGAALLHRVRMSKQEEPPMNRPKS
jgi:hypothetical protein